MPAESRVSPTPDRGMKDDGDGEGCGCGQFCRQFSALVRKNALTKRRAPCQLVRESCLHWLASQGVPGGWFSDDLLAYLPGARWLSC